MTTRIFDVNYVLDSLCNNEQNNKKKKLDDVGTFKVIPGISLIQVAFKIFIWTKVYNKSFLVSRIEKYLSVLKLETSVHFFYAMTIGREVHKDYKIHYCTLLDITFPLFPIIYE